VHPQWVESSHIDPAVKVVRLEREVADGTEWTEFGGTIIESQSSMEVQKKNRPHQVTEKGSPVAAIPSGKRQRHE